jgi:hypothetical protein
MAAHIRKFLLLALILKHPKIRFCSILRIALMNIANYFRRNSQSSSIAASVSEDNPSLSVIHLPTKSFKIILEIQTFPNEHFEMKADDVALICHSFKTAVTGTLQITNFRLRFSPQNVEGSQLAQFYREFSAIFPPLEKPFDGIPLGCISRIEKIDRQNGHFMFGGGENKDSLDIHFKDFR